jgi:hypothetical protein
MLNQLLKRTWAVWRSSARRTRASGIRPVACRDSLGPSGSGDAPVSRLIAIPGCGEAALYDSAIAESDQVVLITTPGRKRLKQLEPLLAVTRELGYPLAGWILMSR